jgi:hypothetical protein
VSTQQTGIEMIAAERQRQIDVEGYTTEHDAEHDYEGALALAGATYALPDRFRGRDPLDRDALPRTWPWPSRFWKPTPDDRVRELVKAGALIAAEIDRIQTEATR